jgi:hypothetical protein
MRVDRCAVLGPKTGWVRLGFTNRSEIVADEVIFLVVYNGAERSVDVGRFSSGISIIHEFPAGFAYGTHAETSCGVLLVHFVDGSQWKSQK